ncbi:uncharacterized protein LOC134215123 [Armigeres subalbatus]|uniref:uncharacterized protein LOC134215123 n=1 Tax=Armigeres subalbatus TaxID=124917 RepID=UPI002ED166A4
MDKSDAGPSSGPSKRNKVKKRCFWSAAQIDLLFELWADKIGALRGTRKNSHIFEEMRQSFNDHGYHVSATDIKTRIHNMTARYRKEKAAVGPSGGSPSEWSLFDRVNGILGSFRIHNVNSVVVDSIIDEDFCVEYLEEDPAFPYIQPSYTATQEVTETQEITETQESISPLVSPSQPERPPSKLRRNKSLHADLMYEFKRTNARIEFELDRLRNADEDVLQMERERNEILRDMADNSKELNGALIHFLSK